VKSPNISVGLAEACAKSLEIKHEMSMFSKSTTTSSLVAEAVLTFTEDLLHSVRGAHNGKLVCIANL